MWARTHWELKSKYRHLSEDAFPVNGIMNERQIKDRINKIIPMLFQIFWLNDGVILHEIVEDKIESEEKSCVLVVKNKDSGVRQLDQVSDLSLTV